MRGHSPASRAETPAPSPGKRAPALPRLPACHALFRQAGTRIFQTGKRILRAMLAVFRTGRRQRLALGDRVPSPGPHLAAQPERRNRRLSYPPPSHKACLGNMDRAALIARFAPACLVGPVSPYPLLPAGTGNPTHNAPPGATDGASPSIAPPHCPETRMLSRPRTVHCRSIFTFADREFRPSAQEHGKRADRVAQTHAFPRVVPRFGPPPILQRSR